MRAEGSDVRGMLLPVCLVSMAIVGLALLLANGSAAASPHSVDLALNDTANIKYVEAGGEANFNFTLENANGTDDFNDIIVDIPDEPEEWQHLVWGVTQGGVRSSTIELELRLSRGERAILNLRLYPPEDAPDGAYWMNVTAWLKSDEGINDSQSVCVVVGEPYDFELELTNVPSEGYYAAIPPSQITLSALVRNLGRSEDRYRVLYGSSRAAEGWTVSPEGTALDPEGWTPTLAGDPSGASAHSFNLIVRIPEGATSGLRCRVDVVVTSSAGARPMNKAVNATVEALQFFNFSVIIDGTDRKECMPGEQLSFQLMIWNKGNGVDRFTIEPEWDKELARGFVAVPRPGSVELPRDETALVSYIVSTPESALRRVYLFTVKVASSSPNLAIVSMELQVEVLQVFGVELSSPQPVMSTYPGGILDFQVHLRNTGNGLDSMTVRLLDVPRKWLEYVQPPEVTLLQDEEALISIRIIVPSTFGEAPAMHNSFTVIGESAGSDAVGTLVLHVNLMQFYRIEWMYLDLPITDDSSPKARPDIIMPLRTLNPLERDGFELPLDLKNYGNGDDNVTIVASAVDPRVAVEVSPTSKMLRSGQLLIVKLHVTVPRDLPPGIYRCHANASSQDATRPVKILPFDFEVFRVEVALEPVPGSKPPNMDIMERRPDVNLTEGSSLSLDLGVTNLGQHPVGPLVVRAYDVRAEGGQLVRWNFLNLTTPEIAAGETCKLGGYPYGSTWTSRIVWWANVTGHHTLEFRVEVDHGWNASDDVSSMNVTVLERPSEPGPPLFRSTGWMLVGIVSLAITTSVGLAALLRRKR